ncbi:MAG: hypothetical protein CM15mV74_060 [uncultured marine virus]|nr:MAG: hypothetical protein CM15mV74_060 [uncultured marine virus]
MFRDFSPLPQKYVKEPPEAPERGTLCGAQNRLRSIPKGRFYFMLWAYDLEFWTLDFAPQDYGMHKKMGDRIVYPLVNEGYLQTPIR